MNKGNGVVSGRVPVDSLFNLTRPGGPRAGCSLRKAALDTELRMHGAKESLTECEIQIFLSLARGDRVLVLDHEKGMSWHASVDMTFGEQGLVWVLTDFGERKLLDIGVHTVWRPDDSEACGSFCRETGHLEEEQGFGVVRALYSGFPPHEVATGGTLDSN